MRKHQGRRVQKQCVERKCSEYKWDVKKKVRCQKLEERQEMCDFFFFFGSGTLNRTQFLSQMKENSPGTPKAKQEPIILEQKIRTMSFLNLFL